ncbi:MAG: hypothetical protein ACJ8AD_12870 [Gemmatimonadaceae bacterium]|jgi:hypothetical protein
MRRHFTALLLSSFAVSFIASSAAAQSARDTLIQVKIDRLTPVYRSPSLAANTLVMAPAGEFTMGGLEVQNGFIRVPLKSLKASTPAIAERIRALVAAGDSAGWITGAEVSVRVVRLRIDTVTVTHADTVLRTRIDSATDHSRPNEHRE